jgi:hopene-associated glycosyltransferase HpnB
MIIAVAVTVLAAVAWGYLLLGHGGYWRTDHRLPDCPAGDDPPRPGPGAGNWPCVSAVVPARDEAAILPLTLPTLLRQDYPGWLRVVLVDDTSTDGTAQVASSLADPGSRLRVIAGCPPPAGWAGKVWAMAQGVTAAGESDYLLFTDADISWSPDALRSLVRVAEGGPFDLVSQMVLLRAESGWERLIVPAFVYFFGQLYPFRRASRASSRTAAAAGGCMLVRRSALAAAGGLQMISGARIDDVALARLLKGSPARSPCWLGFSVDLESRRPYPTLRSLWEMIARNAYTQLRYSPMLLALVVIGLAWIYLVPPVAAVGGLTVWLANGTVAAAVTAAAGWAAALVMTATYVPVLRMYRLSPLRAATLPLVAVLYAAMTVDSARRHHSGRGGSWKGRVVDRAAG